MATSIGAHFVRNTLCLCALGCGVTGVLLLPVYPMVGVALCAVALADLALVWLLTARSPGIQAGAGQAAHMPACMAREGSPP